MDEKAKKNALLTGLVLLLGLAIWGVWSILAQGTTPTEADFEALSPGLRYEEFTEKFSAKPSKEIEGLTAMEQVDLYDYYFSDQYEKVEKENRYLFFVTQENSVLGFGFDETGVLTQKDLFRTDLTEEETKQPKAGMSREDVVKLLGAPHTRLDGFEGYKATKDSRWFAVRYENGVVAEIRWDLQK